MRSRLRTGKPASRIAASAAKTSAFFCGRLTERLSLSRKLWTPMLTRSTPRSRRTLIRSGRHVSGLVSTEPGIFARSAPMMRSAASSTRASPAASRSVGVPPPIAKRA
jgi:hypothetical protein